MPTTYRPYHPEQTLLLPPSPRDWLPEDHLAYFISETVDILDLKAFYAHYEGDGRRNSPFDPRMMVKVLLYGYATGTFSSRKMARRLHEDVAFRVLCAENFPAHRTIAEFRERHLAEFGFLFLQVVQIAREAGLARMGTLAVDGTKVKASASKHKAMSYARMKREEQRLGAEIAELLARATQTDAEEDARYGVEVRGDELPEELRRREQRREKLQQAVQRLHERQAEEDRAKGRREEPRPPGTPGRAPKREFGEPGDKKQDNFTDPQSRIMKTSSGYEQCYNAQIAVDGESRLILAASVTQNAADRNELLPLVEEIHCQTGQVPAVVLADAGYRSEENFRQLEERSVRAFVSLGREGKALSASSSLTALPATLRMKARLSLPEGRKLYAKRKGIVEPVHGWIKAVLGFRQFSLRGLKKVTGEWMLVCLALNLRQLRPHWDQA